MEAASGIEPLYRALQVSAGGSIGVRLYPYMQVRAFRERRRTPANVGGRGVGAGLETRRYGLVRQSAGDRRSCTVLDDEEYPYKAKERVGAC
jgi:hypothetical protein